MLDKLIELKGLNAYKYEDDILYYQTSKSSSCQKREMLLFQ